jgi:hypothetical protein
LKNVSCFTEVTVPDSPVGVLIGDDLALFVVRPASRGHNPDMRRLRVGFEAHIDHAEEHPPAIGRDLRIADALQLHHVLEGEGMLLLSDSGHGKSNESESGKKKTTHEAISWQMDECSRRKAGSSTSPAVTPAMVGTTR